MRPLDASPWARRFVIAVVALLGLSISATSAAASSVPAWDVPFIQPPALAEAMDSKSCPILEILDVPLQPCVANLSACLQSSSLGTAWRSLAARAEGSMGSFDTLYLSVSGTSLALRAPGKNPWQLHVADAPPFDVIARSAKNGESAWQLHVRATSKALLFALQADDTIGQVNDQPWQQVDRDAYEHAEDGSLTLQGVTLTTLAGPFGPGTPLDVTFAVYCSP